MLLLYIAGQRVWWLQQCPPNSSPNSPNLREGRGTHPWGVKAGYLGAVSTYIASFHPLKIFYLPRSSCAQCHANLPRNIAQSSGEGCPELTQCQSGFWSTLLITEYYMLEYSPKFDGGVPIDLESKHLSCVLQNARWKMKFRRVDPSKKLKTFSIFGART